MEFCRSSWKCAIEWYVYFFSKIKSKTLIIPKNGSSCMSRIWEYIEGHISSDSMTFIYAHWFQLLKCLQQEKRRWLSRWLGSKKSSDWKKGEVLPELCHSSCNMCGHFWADWYSASIGYSCTKLQKWYNAILNLQRGDSTGYRNANEPMLYTWLSLVLLGTEATTIAIYFPLTYYPSVGWLP